MAFINNPRHGKTVSGGAPRIVYGLKEANSQSFKAGQLVYDAGSAAGGQITACASDASAILGIAMKDATNVSSGNIEIPVALIEDGDEIFIKITNGGTLTASTTPLTLKNYALYVASNICYMDYADTGNDSIIFLEPVYDQLGAATYWGKVRFLPSVLQVHVGV
jgi:hypothetical protein